MSKEVRAFSVSEFQSLDLLDYDKYSSKVCHINQEMDGESTKGEWFYAQKEPHECEHGTFMVIYHGTWGNYNSPGASDYTFASMYNVDDSEDMEQYEKDLTAWNESPDWLD